MTNVVFADENWNKFINKLTTEFKPKAIGIVNRSAQFAKRNIVELYPRRTGQLRNSYNAKKTDDLSYIVQSSLDPKRSDGFEDGTRAHTIYPRRAKMLTIPLRDDVLVSTRSRISKPSLDKLFRLLKKRGEKTLKEIYDEAGIVLTKKANIPAIPGKHIIRDRVTPNTQAFMDKELATTAKELGFD